VKLFRKPNSRFYWYDFTVRGHRYRRSTQETKLARAAKAASVKLGSVIRSISKHACQPHNNRDLLLFINPPGRTCPLTQKGQMPDGQSWR